MSDSAPSFPLSIEKSELRSNLNGIFLGTFLMGMYTVVYLGTIYAYFARSSAKRLFVPTAVTILYLSNVVAFAFQWYDTLWDLVDNGDTRDSTFIALYNYPSWLIVALSTPMYLAFSVSDGLLIWRCFFVWNRSFRVISVPLFLLIAESGFFIAQIVLHAIYGGEVLSDALAARLNDLIAAAFFLTFTTTIITTTLIAYRIYSVTKDEGISARRFKHVLDIVIQSGVVYALSSLAYAISFVVPGGIPQPRIIALDDYLESVVPYVSGISVTIMVARVALLSTDTTFPSTSVHLSGLQFQAQSTHYANTQADVEIVHPIDVDRSSDGEAEKS